jgi:NAD(P)-dependent dehydrogenase (short-subunit alcohol dehydrogenase family)
MTSVPVALVTAGSAGLGAAVVRCFASNGYRVVINYNSSADKATNLLEILPLHPDTKGSLQTDFHMCIQADIESRHDVERLVAETYSRMGRLDVIFSNGGWTQPRDMTSIDENAFEEEWDRAFNMNVKSHLWLLHAAKSYLDATEGCFISTASVSGLGHNGSSLVILLVLLS